MKRAAVSAPSVITAVHKQRRLEKAIRTFRVTYLELMRWVSHEKTTSSLEERAELGDDRERGQVGESTKTNRRRANRT